MTVPDPLAAAQEQLHRRRHQRRQERIAQQLPVHTDIHGRSIISRPPGSPPTSPPREVQQRDHESQPFAQCLRTSAELKAARAQREAAIALSWLPKRSVGARGNDSCPAPETARPPERTATLTLHPDLALAMLQKNLSSQGRLWLLLRHLDQAGCGWVSVAHARKRLTGQKSPLRFCGWRQMRNLLAQGDDLFWQRNAPSSSPDRIWLRSPAKVALALGVPRFSKRPVSVPLTILLEPIGTVRAHFFASFHSGRDSHRPIARQTLAKITGVGRRSQRNYEKKAGVKKQHNWALGAEYSPSEVQQRAWRHGRAVFQLKDHQGKSGPAGVAYVTWQMPNSYTGPHTPQTMNRKKRINQQLADLLNEGTTGNGEQKVEEPAFHNTGSTSRYFEHGRAAARAYNSNAGNDLYWRTAASFRQYRVWHILPAQEDLKP